jgi:hypothetical protein
VLPEAAEAKEPMNPGGVVAGAVADDGVVGKILAQPDHDRAEIDGARLLGRSLRPGQILGMCRFGVTTRRARYFEILQRRGKSRRRGVDRQRRAVDAPKLFRAGMDVHERHLRPRNVEQRVALRRQFAHAAADQHDQVRGFDAVDEPRIGTDAEIACITGMQRIEEMQPAKGRADRKRVLLRKARDAIACLLRPAAAAQDQYRRPRGAEKLRELLHLRRPGRGLDRQICRRIIDADTLGQHVLGQADDDRPRPAVRRRIESA